MHYFKRNIGDYHKKAGRLTMLEHGAYTLLLDACYDRERFPTEAEAIDWCWARTEEEEAAVRFVLSKFFTQVDGVFVQERIQDEIAAYHAKSQKNKEIAEQREEAKRTKRAQAGTKRTPGEHERAPNQEPLTTNQEPVDNNPLPPSAGGFAEFWSAYPLKKAKATAEKAWAKLKPSADLQAAILSAIAAHKLTADWQRDGGQYIPHPTTWLNQRRWEDEVTHASSTRSDSVRPLSAVDAVKQAIAEREARSAAAGQAVDQDGGTLWEEMDGEFRCVG